MTISQSRYGASAEVGRNYTRPPVKDQSAKLTAAGLGLAGAGFGAYKYGINKPKNADLALRRAEARLGQVELALARAKEQKKATAELKRGLSVAERQRQGARIGYDKVARSSKMLRRGGRAGLIAGLGLAAGSLYATERKRGTFGYRRPTSHGAYNEGM